MSEATDRAMFSRIVQDWHRASGMTWTGLAKTVGMSKAHLLRIAYGTGLASMETTMLLAEAIPAPSLPTIMTRIRSRNCPRCGVLFVAPKHGRHQVYCSGDCQNIAQKERTGERQYRGVMSELRITRARLVVFAEAVDAFCRACSDGACEMPDCELRDVSPLELSKRAAS